MVPAIMLTVHKLNALAGNTTEITLFIGDGHTVHQEPFRFENVKLY
jgi:hypothetical protein